MTNLVSILKSRDITLPTKVCLVKTMVFPVVMYRCESWIVKKAEHRRIDAFELWYWRRLLRVPWTARIFSKSILKEICPKYSLEGLMLKLKLLILWPPDVKNWLTGKDPGDGKEWRWEEKGTTEDEMVGWHHWLNGHEFQLAPGVGDGQGGVACCSPRGRKEVRHDCATEWMSEVVFVSLILHMKKMRQKIKSAVLFSRQVVSSSLWPHELCHARLPCLSLSPLVCSNSCPYT